MSIMYDHVCDEEVTVSRVVKFAVLVLFRCLKQTI